MILRSQVARCVAWPLASTSSSRDEVTDGFAAAAHRDPIAGSINVDPDPAKTRAPFGQRLTHEY